MKKSIALVFSGLFASALFAGMNNVVITFATGANDAYADGTPVAKGECYALVWTPGDATFAGFNSDGTAVAPSKVVIKAPVAEPGVSRNIQFQVKDDEGYIKNNFPSGTWGVYLLDTRVYATEEVRVLVDGEESVQKQVVTDAAGNKVVAGVGGAVKGYGAVASEVSASIGSATAAGAVATDALSADLTPPTITDIKVRDGVVYLRLSGTKKDVAYGVGAGTTPSALKPTDDRPVVGDASGETLIVTPAKGASGFYQGIVR